MAAVTRTRPQHEHGPVPAAGLLVGTTGRQDVSPAEESLKIQSQPWDLHPLFAKKRDNRAICPEREQGKVPSSAQGCWILSLRI